jgi:hypothetical protein
MDCDDARRQILAGGTVGWHGESVLLEFGIRGIREDLDSIGTALSPATTELCKDGIQQQGGQHHG